MKPNLSTKFARTALLTIALGFIAPALASQDPIQAGSDIAVVHTQAGKIQGYIHNDILTYKGIAYAMAERFMPPQKSGKMAGRKISKIAIRNESKGNENARETL